MLKDTYDQIYAPMSKTEEQEREQKDACPETEQANNTERAQSDTEWAAERTIQINELPNDAKTQNAVRPITCRSEIPRHPIGVSLRVKRK